MATLCRHFRKAHSGIGYRKELRRYLLSKNYECGISWEARLADPLLKKYNFNDLAKDMFARYETKKVIEAADMCMLSAKMSEMNIANVNLAEQILYQYRHSAAFQPMHPSIVEGVVRAFIKLDIGEQLMPLIKDKMNYGLIPDLYSANLLMDYLIEKQYFKDAAEVAYEMMLQEDFSNKITFLLSLHVCCKRLEYLGSEPPPVEEVVEVDEEEIQWKRVKLVDAPYYDDHFDITDERHLLGKTLYMLGLTCNDNALLARTLQFVGLGLWNKFPKALWLLEQWSSENHKQVILEEQLTLFGNFLEWAPVRDADESDKNFYLQTIEDEKRRLRLTQEEKDNCTEKYQNLCEQLKDEGKVSTEILKDIVDKIVSFDISSNEAVDIELQREKLRKYQREVNEMYTKQLRKSKQEQIQQVVIEKLVNIAEKEELLTMFENKNALALAKLRKPRDEFKATREKDIDEDEGKRKTKKGVIKKKK